jgi:phosphatidylglycerophosphate synthase
MRTEGELWAREQLAILRERRFSPPAAAAFLLAAQQRTNKVRAERHELTRQARQWTSLGAGSWLALGLRGSGEARARVRRGLLWWAACGLMLDWHLGMVETLDGRPCLLGPADALTLARAWLVPLAWERPTPLTCAVAGLSDALDGPIARRRAPTRAGRDFDWVADACFAAAALRGAARHRLLERWALAAEGTWLSVGVARALYAYFIGLDQPDRSVTNSARAFAPLRIAGLLAGAAARRREGSALLGGGALASLALSGYELARRARPWASSEVALGSRRCRSSRVVCHVDGWGFGVP